MKPPLNPSKLHEILLTLHQIPKTFPKLLGYWPGVWITPPRASNGAWQWLVRLQVHFASGPNGVDLVGFDGGLVRFHGGY